jgi:hypothetical protein
VSFLRTLLESYAAAIPIAGAVLAALAMLVDKAWRPNLKYKHYRSDDGRSHLFVIRNLDEIFHRDELIVSLECKLAPRRIQVRAGPWFEKLTALSRDEIAQLTPRKDRHRHATKNPPGSVFQCTLKQVPPEAKFGIAVDFVHKVDDDDVKLWVDPSSPLKVRKWEPLQRLVGPGRFWYFFWRLAFGLMLFLSVFMGLVTVRGQRLAADFWLVSLGIVSLAVVFLLVIPSRGKKTALGYLESPDEATWPKPGG